MDNLIEELNRKLDSMTEEEKQKMWEELEPWSHVGPPVDEYMEFLEKNYPLK